MFILRISLCLCLLTLFNACQSSRDSDERSSNIIGQWCSPEIEFKGLDLSGLTAEEKSQYQFYLGGLEKLFDNMCIEYFDDRASKRDSYQVSLKLPGEKEEQTEFGDYEILANGKRLVLHTQDLDQLDIELTELSKEKLTWRIPLLEFGLLSGEEMELPEEMADVVMYMTLHKDKTKRNNTIL